MQVRSLILPSFFAMKNPTNAKKHTVKELTLRANQDVPSATASSRDFLMEFWLGSCRAEGAWRSDMMQVSLGQISYIRLTGVEYSTDVISISVLIILTNEFARKGDIPSLSKNSPIYKYITKYY